ncbi:MAG: CGNR zinc finger domain-containing protein [Phyllobacterium sp.]
MDKNSPAILVGDTLGLDFLNSVATPAANMPVDWIKDGDGLLRWLEQAKMVPRETLDAIRSQAATGELDKVADEAGKLREWFRTFVLKYKGKPLPAGAIAELEPINRLLEHDEAYGRIVPQKHGKGLELRFMRKWRSSEALLLPIGEALGRFLCTEDFSNVKACEGPHCTLLFVDHTRGHRRRWCSMALCGNRAKQAAHRNRLRQV